MLFCDATRGAHTYLQASHRPLVYMCRYFNYPTCCRLKVTFANLTGIHFRGAAAVWKYINPWKIIAVAGESAWTDH